MADETKTDTQAKVATRSEPKQPASAAMPDVPAQDGDETFWEQGKWSGIDKFTCLWKVKHSQADGQYDLPCRKDFWSHEQLMAHIRDDH